MISPDIPITKTDEDKLNRGTFAKNLAKTISNYSFPSSFTIGIYGTWGSGKTSLLNMVIENIKDIDDNTVILNFNPWLCTDPKQLIIQFFKQMAIEIKLKKPTAEKTWELIDQYADIFDVASLIPGVGNVIVPTGKILRKKAKKQVEQRANNLQKNKNQIIDKMIKEKIKIAVFIDDIDRLSEEEIIAVFQLIKALADFPNTVYILAFDYDVVISALSKVQHGDGREYLEKIIQVPFEIPAPSLTSIHDILLLKLADILKDLPQKRLEEGIWIELLQFGLKKYVKSIRDVIRYTNVFLLKYELLKDETDMVDLLALTTLQVFEPTVYSKLPYYKDTLCGTNYDFSYDGQETEKENIKKTVSLLIPDDKTITNFKAANNILNILFPKTRININILYNIGRNCPDQDLLINNNIANPKCFDRYFGLALESDAIPTDIIKHLIYKSTEKEFYEGIMQIYQDGKIIRLLEEIEAYANRTNSEDITIERASLIINILSSSWSLFKVENRGDFSIPFVWRLLYCVKPLLKMMDPESRFSCICSVFKNEDIQPSTLSLLLNDFESQQGRFTEKTINTEDAMFSLEEVLELEEIFKTRAVEALDCIDVLKQYRGLNFLWTLEQIEPELVTKKKREIITDDILLAKVITYCTSLGTAVTKRVTKTRNVNFDTIGEFIDVDEAYKRIKEFIATSQFFTLPKDDQMNAIAFILTIEHEDSQSILENNIEEDYIIKMLEILKRKNSNDKR